MADGEVALAALAASQHGLFTVDDAVGRGVSMKVLQRRIAAGLLVERQPGVLSPPSTPYDVTAAGRAALLSLGPSAMLSHLSAAVEWELRRAVPERPWVTIPWSRTVPTLWDAEIVRSRHLEGVRRMCNGVPVTSPPRTVVDLGRVLDRDGVESALAVALQRSVANMEELQRALTTAYRTAGTGLVRDVLRHFDPAWESVLSARLGRLLTGAGLALVPGLAIRDATGSVVAVADFADPVRRLVVEADGWAYHGSQAQQQADRRRDRTLLVLGWRTVRYTTADILTRPDEVLAELVGLLAQPAA